MLRDCPHSRLFWDSLAIPIQPDLFYGSNLEVWLRINCVSQQKSFSGRAGGGGLIRDPNGDWVCGYARAIGHTTSVAAKLWAIRDGINLCIEINLTNIVIELDAKIVVDLLLEDEGNMNVNDVIIVDCKAGLRRLPGV
nr:putative ribonuclease h protein [Quercus suber]